MAQFTKEELEQIRMENEKSDLRQFLKGCYTKIQDGLRKLDERSAERAVWELVQNARDLSEHAKIRIRLLNNSIVFEHFGFPFDFDSLSSLVKQVSSQDKEKGDKVGQYGTGFMTTHKFSKKVYIQGDYEVSVGDKTLYADLLDYRDEEHPMEFCLDRSETDVDSFANEMFEEIENIKKLRFHANHDAPIGKTSFRYELSEEKCAAYYPQIRQSLNLLPYVIAFNDRIDEIEYYDEVLGKNFVYRRKAEFYEAIPDTTDSEKVVYVIEREFNGDKKELRVSLLVNTDRSNRIVLPPLPISYDDVSVIPSLFIFFPLLKTENWGINFIYHSSDLWPTEPRDCYQMPYNNEDVQVRAEHNAKVIKEMDDMLFNYYNRMVAEQSTISIDFAKVNFCAPDNADSDTVAYVDLLQKRWVDHITNWAVIPTKEGMRRISEPDVAVLSQELFSNLTEEQINQYLPVMAAFAEKVKLIPNRDIQEWTNRVREWNDDEKSYYVSISDICQSIKSKEDELHSFLVLLNAIGKTEYMKEYALIPNREGKLCKAGDLRSGLQITSELYSLASPLLDAKLHVLVDPAYEDVYELSKYTRENLRDDMTSLISNWRSNVLGQMVCLKSDSEVEYGGDDSLLSYLLNYCNAYRTQNPNSQRRDLLKLLSQLYSINLQQTFIPRVDGEDENLDLYNTAYMYLWEDTLLWLSKREPKWLSDAANRAVLTKIIMLLNQLNDRTRNDMYTKYAIFPNRNNKMCLLADLCACDVDETELFSLYSSVVDKDLNEQLVGHDYESLVVFKIKTGKNIGDEIDEKLRVDGYKNKAVLTIIRHLDKNEWVDYFPNINLQKRELQYNQCDDHVRDSIYRLQMNDDDGSILARMANLVETENVMDILDIAEKQVEDLKEKNRQLEFKCAVGKAIEDALREKMGNDLEFKPEDVQNGQDMIIYKNGKPVYYIEVKSKWNFEQPAYISHNQVEQAVIEKDHYALICVDCRKDDPRLEYGGGCGIAPNATYQEIWEKRSVMLAHTWVHTDIGRRLAPIMEGILEAKRGDDNSTIKVDGDFNGRIPLKVFVKGIGYEQFINELILNLRDI